ncbi:MAG: aldehyde dehydrogenase family protein [Pseudomonadota bacterium]
MSTARTDRLTVTKAYNGQVLDELALEDWDTVDRHLKTAEQLHRSGATLPVYRRIEILEALASGMESEVDAYATLIAQEGGKPLTDARVEVLRAINGVRLAIGEIENSGGVEIPMDLSAAGDGRTAFTRKYPIGPVVAVSAFNHPLNLIVHQAVPAIATGCPVIVKPADTTPLSCLRFVEAVYRAGLPEEWCRAVLTDIPTAERLVTDPRVAFFTFIGSARVGWHLRSKLAPGTRCALEHGGAAPVIVHDDADLERIVPMIVKGGYYHAGQVCVSVQRIFAANPIKDRLVEMLTAQVGALKVGDPELAETEVGPLILPREVDRVASWVDEAVTAGAGKAIGGEKLSDHVYRPTILVDPPADAKVSTLEIFGPVTCVYGFDDLDDAVARANALPVAFQAAVFTQNIDRALKTADRLDASAVMINDHSAFRVDWMPFAGLRQSGLGVGGIPYTMEDMVIDKMTVIRRQSA